MYYTASSFFFADISTSLMRVNREKGFEMSIDKDLDFLSRIQDEWLRRFCEGHGITYYSSNKECVEEENQKQEIIILDFNLD